MKALTALLIFAAALLALWLGAHDSKPDHSRQYKQEISKWKARYSEAALHVQHDVDTVRVLAPRYFAIRDTLRLTDTVQVKAALAHADTAIRACVDLANSCETFRHVADSTLHVQGAALSWYETETRRQRRRARVYRLTTFALGGFVVIRAFK